jgi:oligopeptide/dipeptide ABC transporter ATP-binding protein
MSETLLEVRGLCLSFGAGARILDGMELSLDRGGILSLVGESGSGKSLTALSIPRLVPCPPARYLAGEIRFEGRDMLAASTTELRAARGRRIGMVFQEPRGSLNPVFTVGAQLEEILRLYLGIGPREARRRIPALLAEVGIPDPELRARQYPHELSGGLCQRVALAMALCGQPALLIADEPTSALDASIRRRILERIASLTRERGLAVLYVTHDLGEPAVLGGRVAVALRGRIVEEAASGLLLEQPLHPYTRALYEAREGRVLDGLLQVGEAEGRDDGAGPGCPFHTRCPRGVELCERTRPPLLEVGPGHRVACFLGGRGGIS